jgi:hypothetical protein
MPNWPQVILEDLARSGLGELPEAVALPVIGKDVSQFLPQLNGHAADVDAALVFAYYGADGIPTDPRIYCRARMYWKPASGFRAAQVKDDRPKYLQPPDTGVRLYIPPTFDWAAYRSDSTLPLLITEGEKKALAATSAGLPCVALGGVNSIARNRSEALLPELITLAMRRMVYVIFDVDKGQAGLKPEVAKAARTLCERLAVHAQAMPFLTALPQRTAGEKYALDDWVVERRALSSDGKIDLLDLKPLSTLHTEAIRLFDLNSRYTYVLESKAVADNKTKFLFDKDGFKTAHATHKVVVEELTAVNNQTPQVRPTAKRLGEAWLEWPGRATVLQADYVPGNDDIIIAPSTFNTWSGWACKPKRGATLQDILPFIEALNWLHGPEDSLRMFNWYMYPIANPGGKLFQIPVLQQEREGIGKSAIPSLILEHIYGLGLHGKKGNGWILHAHSMKDGGRLEFAAETQLVLMDDMGDLNDVSNLLKAIATTKSISVNEKFIRQRRVRNLLNVIITTNRTIPLKLTELDRRMFYPYVNQEKNEALWRGLYQWFAEGGSSKVLGYAMDNWAQEAGVGFDAMAPAPFTEKKSEMVELSQTALDEFTQGVVQLAREGGLTRNVATSKELVTMFMVENDVAREADVSRALLAKGLKVAGAVQYPRKVHVGPSTTHVWILHDLAWRDVPTPRMCDELKKPFQRRKG